jgi:hypothetical protein
VQFGFEHGSLHRFPMVLIEKHAHYSRLVSVTQNYKNLDTSKAGQGF